MNTYYEQNVVNNNIDERTRKTKTIGIVKSLCMAFGVFILISSASLGGLFLDMFWIFVLASLPFFAAMIILGIINKRNNTEYDYVVTDDCIKVSDIYFRERRKLKHSIPLRRIESVGVFDSDGYKKAERTTVKKLLALVNYDDEQSIVYILYSTEKGKQILFLEPDRGFIIALRRAMSSTALTVFDKSISELEKRLADKELDDASLEYVEIDDEEAAEREEKADENGEQDVDTAENETEGHDDDKRESD